MVDDMTEKEAVVQKARHLVNALIGERAHDMELMELMEALKETDWYQTQKRVNELMEQVIGEISDRS